MNQHIQGYIKRNAYRTGIGLPLSMGTAVPLFCGEPSMTRSEWVRHIHLPVVLPLANGGLAVQA